jgi:hypothetical protein
MPGFRYCGWCNGKGCIACDAEEKKWKDKAAARAPSWRPPDVRDARDQALADETKRLESLIGVTISSQDQFNKIEAAAHAAIEKTFEPLLDAEYKRQFPDGPKPMFVARAGNASDMELLKQAFHAAKLQEAFGPDGGGIDEIELHAAVAREAQKANGDPPDYS